ncbi:hypothetical protein SAMN05444280_104158 [Tangfeifania diversioriginum]|uniref:Uncharacterized protein n=1 Tax=Tangfeifania diversioriginum TaxID=1168035 RepID=A0A1M6D102_9BACT|nr:hypothetical protein [Tangfeifania diversioriginum]SHI66793.1 hypothetical protein SAMN05444280_104158 [Tangfeifania diversioriginum]
METQEVKQLLQRYFNGESSENDEQKLQAYFHSGNVAAELEEYAGFFGGISELSKTANDDSIENEVMNYILENEAEEKSKYRTLWKTVTGIAASIIIVVGGLLLYQQKDKTYEDTFENPQVAYSVAEDVLEYMSAKYNKGLAELSNFDKLQTASQPLRKGVQPVNEFYENIEKLDTKESESQ